MTVCCVPYHTTVCQCWCTVCYVPYLTAETLRACMMVRNGYDCRGHERNGENMYTFSDYTSCALFAVEAQRALHAANWPPEARG